MLGPAYTIAEASANQHELNPSSIIMMTHLKLFILLSMLMTGSISQIRYNDNLKYEKILFGFAAGKFALDDSHFPSEHSLSDNEYMQAHGKWILLYIRCGNS